MNEIEICEKYKAGLPLRQLSKQFNISELKTKTILNKNNILINRPGAKRKYSLDEHAFDNINEESAYWAGVLLADGSITLKNGSPHYLNLGLKYKDVDHINLFRNFLKSNQPIKERKNGKNTIAILSVSSKVLVDRLLKYGITPNKTPTAHAPNFLKNNRHFWRGVIDGDGWICNHLRKMPMLGLCGSKRLLEQFKEYVATITYTSADINKKKKSEIAWQYQFAGQPAQIMISHFYSGSSIALFRKNERAKFWINNPYYPKQPQWKITVENYQNIAMQWHPTKNTLKPNEVSYGSTKKIWWLCLKGHEWQATPNNRIGKNSGCPSCRNFPRKPLLF